MTATLIGNDTDTTSLVLDLSEAMKPLRLRRPEDLVPVLKEAGCYGQPRNASHCPVAKYLHQRLDPAHPEIMVAVTAGKVLVLERRTGKRGEHLMVLPEVVGEFVHRFDAGDFEELNR